ncbi:hypothetical protein PHYBLDRAFT_72307 [Phycomyces blakesleeanus NRRL 1555(-)]|uniref:Reverse transcriptase domain-containing protein n=1 Tax=Phycomyces blakesleeanus (strain ATCC 8743b / DSM 1359 / FGSC 10004 / NBRC 33097 / NRRL 1555) TaxID=763407 RepID=A0A163CTG0_PHYB8|nr:hypothetical protein PHYBLDRAFT_72307 [Phycomyces blakesleeanus NRRL 1555(-)]OAD65490.1 hypothetical protein PHYBLDRAFT_72307 [Phycomyces blakesleeanus NRRL 1555(-)]|eukprot:XP_018283530.1 hypothetical protein PHYBLDRAFT_72307 [Phycomyces blakesleeanus NRRL 1555(-)]
MPFASVDSPFTLSVVETFMQFMPNCKAPGPDHIHAEMLKPIWSHISSLLACLFTICWQWSYTPSLWRHAQVFSMFKKGDPLDAANYHPISLTSVVSPELHRYSPPLDVAQGGFRPRHGALDQALTAKTS